MALFLTGQRLTADLLNAQLEPSTCHLVQQTPQTGWTSGTATAVTFGSGSTILDTDGIHSESSNTTRVVIGGKLGWWRVTGVYVPATSASSTTLMRAAIGKNGSLISGSFGGLATSFTTTIHGQPAATVEVQATVSTDYVELYGTQTSAGTVGTTVNTFAACSLLAVWDRP